MNCRTFSQNPRTRGKGHHHCPKRNSNLQLPDSKSSVLPAPPPPPTPTIRLYRLLSVSARVNSMALDNGSHAPNIVERDVQQSGVCGIQTVRSACADGKYRAARTVCAERDHVSSLTRDSRPARYLCQSDDRQVKHVKNNQQRSSLPSVRFSLTTNGQQRGHDNAGQ